MYDRDSLTVQLIGGRDLLPATFFQAVLMAEDRIWTSPPYLSRQDAQTTVDYLAHAIAYGECTECQGEPYLLSDIYPQEDWLSVGDEIMFTVSVTCSPSCAEKVNDIRIAR